MAIIQCEYFSQAMRSFRSFTAVLPVDPPPAEGALPEYSKGPWPALYLLHGFSGSRNDWLKNTPIESLACRYGLAVIMPDGGNDFYVDQDYRGTYCGRMTGEELVDVTRKMFSLSDRREDTLIGGLSMGGYGAIRNGLKYRETFGAVMAFSSALIQNRYARGDFRKQTDMGIPYGYYTATFVPEDQMKGSDQDPEALAKAAMRADAIPELFLACGSGDFLFGSNLEFHNALQDMGYDHTWWVEKGVHDFDFWNRAVAAGLEWWRKNKG